MTTLTLSAAVTTLRESCESIDTGKPLRIPADMEIGDMYPQGDIGLLRIKALPKGSTRLDWKSGDYQLAPGNTQGSRHCIPAKSNVAVFRVDDRDGLSDLCLVADAPFDLTHPEHAHHLGYPAGTYRVLHQQNEQRQRVVD